MNAPVPGADRCCCSRHAPAGAYCVLCVVHSVRIGGSIITQRSVPCPVCGDKHHINEARCHTPCPD